MYPFTLTALMILSFYQCDCNVLNCCFLCIYPAVGSPNYLICKLMSFNQLLSLYFLNNPSFPFTLFLQLLTYFRSFDNVPYVFYTLSHCFSLFALIWLSIGLLFSFPILSSACEYIREVVSLLF